MCAASVVESEVRDQTIIQMTGSRAGAKAEEVKGGVKFLSYWLNVG